MFVVSGSQSLQNAQVRGINLQTRVSNLLNDLSSGSSATTAMKYLAAGKVNEIEGSLHSAIECYERALIDDNNLHEARARLALASLKARSLDTAENTAISLVSLNRGFTFGSLVMNRPMSALTVLGEVKFIQGQNDQATLAFQAALSILPGDTLASARLGMIAIAAAQTQIASTSLGTINGMALSSESLQFVTRLATNNASDLAMIRTSGLSTTNMAEQTPLLSTMPLA